MVTPRQAKILAAIVREYSESGTPLGSRELVAKYGWDISPATVRNEMVALTKQGYLSQPHTSAGRIPTDKGFRYFVNELMQHLELSAKERKRLEQELGHLQAKYVQLGQVITKLLSSHTEHAAFAVLPSGVHTWGVGNLLTELSNEEAKKAALFFDRLDEYADKLIAEFAGKEEAVVIGREMPLRHELNSGMVVAGIRLANGEEGVIGVLGSKAMRYDRALSVIRYVMKLVSGSLVVIAIL